MDILDTEQRLKSGKQITMAERAHLIANNKFAFWAFLVENNPGNINNTLKNKMGYSYLGFKPDHKTISGIISNLLQKNDTENLNTLLGSYQFNPNVAIPEELKAELLTHFSHPSGNKVIKRSQNGTPIEWTDSKGNHYYS